MSEPNAGSSSGYTLSTLALLALLFTLANLAKPLVIDDAAYEGYARHIAEHPLDPYGFSLFWYDVPMEANQILAPPVFLYYWGMLRFFGADQPWLWKLGLFPWVLLLTWTVHALVLRFAPRYCRIFLVAILFSPALLPSLNLMLDLPALCLGLTSIELFLRGCERGSWRQVILAGYLAGLAMQTKYTAVVVPALFVWWGVLDRQWAKAILACSVATVLFVGWEAVTHFLYGQSHFLAALGDGGGGLLLGKLPLFPFFTSYLGGLASWTFLVAWLVLGVRRGWLWLGVGVIAAGYTAIALMDVYFVSHVRPSPTLFGPSPASSEKIQLAEVLFNCFATVGLVGLFLAGHRLLQAKPEEASTTSRTSWFLVGWLVLEVLAFFPLTPFAAARRLLGVLVAMTLVLARLASQQALDTERRRWLVGLIGAQVVLAFGYLALDCWGGYHDKRAAEASVAWIRERGDRTIWYTGHWGFQFYAERAGMQAVVPQYSPRKGRIVMPSPSQMEAGDWLVVPGSRLEQQNVFFDRDNLEHMVTLEFGAGIPLRTLPCFYGGRTPIEHHEGPVLRIRILRVRRPFVPLLRTVRPGVDPTKPFDPLGE